MNYSYYCHNKLYLLLEWVVGLTITSPEPDSFSTAAICDMNEEVFAVSWQLASSIYGNLYHPLHFYVCKEITFTHYGQFRNQ